MAVADRHGLPVAVYIESATLHEVASATSTLVQMIVPEAPQKLIGDNAYDSEVFSENGRNLDRYWDVAWTERPWRV